MSMICSFMLIVTCSVITSEIALAEDYGLPKDLLSIISKHGVNPKPVAIETKSPIISIPAQNSSEQLSDYFDRLFGDTDKLNIKHNTFNDTTVRPFEWSERALRNHAINNTVVKNTELIKDNQTKVDYAIENIDNENKMITAIEKHETTKTNKKKKINQFENYVLKGKTITYDVHSTTNFFGTNYIPQIYIENTAFLPEMIIGNTKGTISYFNEFKNENEDKYSLSAKNSNGNSDPRNPNHDSQNPMGFFEDFDTNSENPHNLLNNDVPTHVSNGEHTDKTKTLETTTPKLLTQSIKQISDLRVDDSGDTFDYLDELFKHTTFYNTNNSKEHDLQKYALRTETGFNPKTIKFNSAFNTQNRLNSFLYKNDSVIPEFTKNETSDQLNIKPETSNMNLDTISKSNYNFPVNIKMADNFDAMAENMEYISIKMDKHLNNDDTAVVDSKIDLRFPQNFKVMSKNPFDTYKDDVYDVSTAKKNIIHKASQTTPTNINTMHAMGSSPQYIDENAGKLDYFTTFERQSRRKGKIEIPFKDQTKINYRTDIENYGTTNPHEIDSNTQEPFNLEKILGIFNETNNNDFSAFSANFKKNNGEETLNTEKPYKLDTKETSYETSSKIVDNLNTTSVKENNHSTIKSSDYVDKQEDSSTSKHSIKKRRDRFLDFLNNKELKMRSIHDNVSITVSVKPIIMRTLKYSPIKCRYKSYSVVKRFSDKHPKPPRASWSGV